MITINVTGIPRPGGSKTAFPNRKTGKIIIAPASKHTATWRKEVQSAARSQYNGELLAGAIKVRYEFRFPRPKHHFGTGKNSHVLKRDAPHYHISTPDMTKIIRSTEDALTDVIWKDDSLVCFGHQVKRYCTFDEAPGVEILITELF